MAKGKLTGTRPFTGRDDPRSNNKGRPKVPEDIKAVRSMTRDEFIARMKNIWELDKEGLKKLMSDPSTKMHDLFAASVLSHGTSKGDSVRMNFMLDQIFGKQKTELALTGKDGGPIQVEHSQLDGIAPEQIAEMAGKIVMEQIEKSK